MPNVYNLRSRAIPVPDDGPATYGTFSSDSRAYSSRSLGDTIGSMLNNISFQDAQEPVCLTCGPSPPTVRYCEKKKEKDWNQKSLYLDIFRSLPIAREVKFQIASEITKVLPWKRKEKRKFLRNVIK